jgi:hypothetical protein
MASVRRLTASGRVDRRRQKKLISRDTTISAEEVGLESPADFLPPEVAAHNTSLYLKLSRIPTRQLVRLKTNYGVEPRDIAALETTKSFQFFMEEEC